jgi:hypothetical protein
MNMVNKLTFSEYKLKNSNEIIFGVGDCMAGIFIPSPLPAFNVLI